MAKRKFTNLDGNFIQDVCERIFRGQGISEGLFDYSDLYTKLLNFPSTGSALGPPISGSHTATELVLNSAPTEGAPIGWVCVVSGTPGTWLPWGRIGVVAEE